jgi:hypothetical protein
MLKIENFYAILIGYNDKKKKTNFEIIVDKNDTEATLKKFIENLKLINNFSLCKIQFCYFEKDTGLFKKKKKKNE